MENNSPAQTKGPDQRIMVVSLDGRDQWKAYAALGDEIVYVLKMIPIQGPRPMWKAKLIDEIEQKLESNYTVLVEDRAGSIGRIATPFDFEERHEFEAETNLAVAMRYYYSLIRSGDAPQASNLRIKPEYQRFYLGSDLVDIDRDDKGRQKFNVNWDAFTGGHRCVLMCVMAAYMEPINDRFFSIMFPRTEYPEPSDTFATLRSILKHRGHPWREHRIDPPPGFGKTGGRVTE